MFEYQEKNRYYAQTQRGLEETARSELEELGAENCSEGYCGVHFTAPKATMYKINYCARTITRVLAPLASFKSDTENFLYHQALKIEWDQILSLDKTFAVFADVSLSRITHSKFAGYKIKDAIADYFRNKTGDRPNVDPRRPDTWISLNIHKDNATISLDTSGGSLHRRSYRRTSVEAPLQETLAAAIIRMSGWAREEEGEIPPLMDPMCGSGTFLAEAMMHYCRIPAGFKRKWFGFFHLPDFDYALWSEVRAECDRQIRELPPMMIRGSDVSRKAVEAAVKNLNEIPGGARVPVSRMDFRDIEEAEKMMIITNPPYGVRLSYMEETQRLYKEFGDFLKQKCTGSTAFILAGSKELSKYIGLKASRRIPFFNGPIDARLIKLELY